jgi:hypothetical protein
MAMVEAALKSSSIPLFQRGKFRSSTLTPLWKRGEGEIFGAVRENYVANFWVRLAIAIPVNRRKNTIHD